MQKIIGTSLALSLLCLLVACGNSAKNDKGDLGDKKVKLEKLKGDKSKLDAEIRALEGEIAKVDTSAASTKKLVSIETVGTQDFTHFIELQGRVDAKNASYVSPNGGGGIVKAVYVTAGQPVRKGQLLVKLDDAVALQQVAARQQEVAGLEAQAKLAQSVYERQQNLWKQDIGTEVQVLQAKTNAEGTASQLSAARAGFRAAQEQANYSSVHAEISGTIDILDVRVGEFFRGIGPDNRTPQIAIVNTSDLKVKVPVPENYLAKISIGTPLQVVFPELNNRTIKTTVSVVSKLIDPTTRSFYIEGKLPPEKDLRPNQIATVKIEDYKSANAVTIPINVVQSDETGKYVYTVETLNGNTVARRKTVLVGQAYGGLIEVKSGIKNGDQIITEGYQSVYDGQAIATAK
jgi:membrane fusion protein (multidrug efflux system)